MELPSNTRDPCHWALWLERSDGQSVILQVGDDKNGRSYYVEDPIYKEPMRSTKLAEVINCATLPSNKHELAVIIIQDHPVNNESTTWNCQDWVGLLQVSPDVKENLRGKRQHWQWRQCFDAQMIKRQTAFEITLLKIHARSECQLRSLNCFVITCTSSNEFFWLLI